VGVQVRFGRLAARLEFERFEINKIGALAGNILAVAAGVSCFDDRT
jgi:hypothetical protein